MTKFRMIMQVAVLLLISGASTKCGAQSMDIVRDSLARVTSIKVLTYQFMIAGELHKAEKYKLPYQSTIKVDSLYQDCIATYKTTFNTIKPIQRPAFFSDSFYKQVIPIVQYFRNPDIASMFLQHRETLHPKAPVPDPKHHDADLHHTHNHE